MSNYNTQDNLTQASIPTSAQTGGFAAAGGAQPQASQSSPFAAGLQGQQPQATLGGHTLGQDPSLASGNMHPTPIAPSTYNALNAGALDASSTGSHSSSLSQQQPQAGSTISSFGNAAGNHPQHSEPNIPAAASSLAAKAPTAEEIKARGAAFVDQSAALAEQARTKAGEFVAPKEKEQLNPAEKHVDNLAGGIAGMVLTAPLAAVEKVSPVVADKLSAAASAASVQLQNAASSAGPVASSYAQSAVDAARGVLPAALGGRPAQSVCLLLFSRSRSQSDLPLLYYRPAPSARPPRPPRPLEPFVFPLSLSLLLADTPYTQTGTHRDRARHRSRVQRGLLGSIDRHFGCSVRSIDPRFRCSDGAELPPC